MQKLQAIWLLYAVFIVAIISPQVSGFNFTAATIADVQAAIRQGYMTCRQVVQGYLDRIDKYGGAGDKTIGAIIAKNPNALKEADDLDVHFRKYGKLKGRLHCAPLVAKDCIDIAGIPTTSGLNIFKAQIPLKDATVVKNCKTQGAIFIAKANLSPLTVTASWGHSETGGLIRNPFGLAYSTYGSSGGNGAAASAMLGIGGIGTETDVSINLPTSAASVVGIRAPVDLLKACDCRDGVLPNNLYQDVVGPIARRAEDAVLIIDGMIGKEGEYSSTVLNPRGLVNMKINILPSLAYGDFTIPPGLHYKVDPKISQLITAASDAMVRAGASVKNATVDIMSVIAEIMQLSMTSTFSCYAGWLNGYFGDVTRFGKGPGIYHSLEEILAAKQMPTYHQNYWGSVQAQGDPDECTNQTQEYMAARATLVNHGMKLLLADADIVIVPTMPVFPSKLSQAAFDMKFDDPGEPAQNMLTPQLSSWIGFPSATVPLGFSDPTTDAPQGLPIGLYMLTSPDKFPLLLKAVYAYQQNYDVSQFPANFIGDVPSSANGIAAPSLVIAIFMLSIHLFLEF